MWNCTSASYDDDSHHRLHLIQIHSRVRSYCLGYRLGVSGQGLEVRIRVSLGKEYVALLRVLSTSYIFITLGTRTTLVCSNLGASGDNRD